MNFIVLIIMDNGIGIVINIVIGLLSGLSYDSVMNLIIGILIKIG